MRCQLQRIAAGKLVGMPGDIIDVEDDETYKTLIATGQALPVDEDGNPIVDAPIPHVHTEATIHGHSTTRSANRGRSE